MKAREAALSISRALRRMPSSRDMLGGMPDNSFKALAADLEQAMNRMAIAEEDVTRAEGELAQAQGNHEAARELVASIRDQIFEQYPMLRPDPEPDAQEVMTIEDPTPPIHWTYDPERDPLIRDDERDDDTGFDPAEPRGFRRVEQP